MMRTKEEAEQLEKETQQQAVTLFSVINDHLTANKPSPEAIKRALLATAILALGEGDLTV